MIVYRLKVFGLYREPGDFWVFHQALADGPDHIFDEHGPSEGLLGNKLLVGALKHRVDFTRGTIFNDFYQVLDPKEALESNPHPNNSPLVMGPLAGDLQRTGADCSHRNVDFKDQVPPVFPA